MCVTFTRQTTGSKSEILSGARGNNGNPSAVTPGGLRGSFAWQRGTLCTGARVTGLPVFLYTPNANGKWMGAEVWNRSRIASLFIMDFQLVLTVNGWSCIAVSFQWYTSIKQAFSCSAKLSMTSILWQIRGFNFGICKWSFRTRSYGKYLEVIKSECGKFTRAIYNAELLYSRSSHVLTFIHSFIHLRLCGSQQLYNEYDNKMSTISIILFISCN